MRKIVSNFFISLDGVVEAPEKWHFPYLDDAMGAVINDGMQRNTALLLGRRLYDEWAQFWPAQGPDVPLAAVLNGQPKYVVTHRPIEGEPWHNTTVLAGDAATAIRALKAGDGGDIGMSGSASTVRWLLAEGLLDELNLLVHPIAVGHGQRVFDDTGTVALNLLASDTLPSGVMHVRYAPVTP